MFGKNQRKTVIVDGATQLRIVVATSLPMFACLVLSTFVEIFFTREIHAGRFHSDVTILGFPARRLGMLCFFVTASTAQLLSALLTSHRVAGTSYRIAKTLREFRQGERTVRVQLRKNDYQHKLAEDVNELLDWVQNGAKDEPATESRDKRTETAEMESPHAVPSSRPGVKPADPRNRETAGRKDR